jgi:S-adenosyl methyltransferase
VAKAEHADQPNVARIYDYLLGGKDHFAADREAAQPPPAQPAQPAQAASPQAGMLAGVGRKRP